MLTNLKGQIERITYTNEENGYTIARVKIPGTKDLVTVVGSFMSPSPGEILQMTGEWSNHPKYGEQFKVVSYKTSVPATAYGIRKYLGSGLIRGVGPKIAERIVTRFGADTLDVIEDRIDTLCEVEGIGKKRIAMIQKAWADQKEIREVMVFLQAHGVSSGYATKIFKQYGNDAIAVVRENPFRLAADIFGIGFVTADRIAEKLGIPKDSPFRAEAGILYVLHELADEGHVYYPYEPLVEKSLETLDVDREIITHALGRLCTEKKLVIEDINEDIDQYVANNKAVYLAKYHLCETRVAKKIKLLKRMPKSIRAVDAGKALDWVQQNLSIILADNQAAAVQNALENKMLIITGGPGTGKTTIIHAILTIFIRLGVKILLAAPTGRAAKRMTEATGREAKTIHRMLEYSMSKGGFQRNEESPLDCDVLIVDEASMIDIVLMHHLLKAVPPSVTLILVGDVNQLPSVGAGNVLNDLIASCAVPVAVLTEVFRQAKESRIIVNAHRINQGKMPVSDNALTGDFFFIQKEEPGQVLDLILKLVSERIPARFGYDPVNDIQVLAPMNRGLVGTAGLNTELQKHLNPSGQGINRGYRMFLTGDKVMQIKNNYDKEVYNGDIGRIVRISAEDHEVTVCFDNRNVIYDYSELDEIVLAYAVSVHKSQGSEYPVVVMPVLTQHFMLLQRNLIYTAVTRGKKLVVLVGTRKALAIGIKNDKTRKRYTCLKQRLMEHMDVFSKNNPSISPHKLIPPEKHPF